MTIEKLFGLDEESRAQTLKNALAFEGRKQSMVGWRVVARVRDSEDLPEHKRWEPIIRIVRCDTFDKPDRTLCAVALYTNDQLRRPPEEFAVLRTANEMNEGLTGRLAFERPLDTTRESVLPETCLKIVADNFAAAACAGIRREIIAEILPVGQGRMRLFAPDELTVLIPYESAFKAPGRTAAPSEPKSPRPA